jgi:hypothetical protein
MTWFNAYRCSGRCYCESNPARKQTKKKKSLAPSMHTWMGLRDLRPASIQMPPEFTCKTLDLESTPGGRLSFVVTVASIKCGDTAET